MDLKNTLKTLSNAYGPFGREEAIAQLVKEYLEPLCVTVEIDNLYNVIGVKPGTGVEPRPQLLLTAHLDEIQMMVTHVEGPFVRVRQFSYDPRVLVGQEVVILGRRQLTGVIGDRAPHVLSAGERKSMPGIADLVVDLGLDADAVTANVRAGDPVLVRGRFLELLGDRVAGKALDNRVSIAAALTTLEILQYRQHPCDLLFLASAGEEFRYNPVAAAAYRLQPDLAVVLDTTFARQPGTLGSESYKLGSGPVISVGPNMHTAITDRLQDICEALEIPSEIEPLPGHSGTDAWDVQVSGKGVPCGLVGVPIRNMHTPVEVVDLSDVTRLSRLVAEFAMQVDDSFVQTLTFTLPDMEPLAHESA